MADYEILAIKAAIAMGYSAEQFQDMLNRSIKHMLYTFSMSDITVKALSILMENQKGKKWEGSVADLHMACHKILTGKVLKSEQALFPKNESAFSRRIKSMEKQLKNIGIFFAMKKRSKYMHIALYCEDINV